MLQVLRDPTTPPGRRTEVAKFVAPYLEYRVRVSRSRRGEFRNLRGEEHADDALNYFYRALLSMAFAAKAFGDEELFSQMRATAAKLEERMKALRG